MTDKTNTPILYAPTEEELDRELKAMYEQMAIEDEKERLHKIEILRQVKKLLPAKKYRGLIDYLEYYHEGFLDDSCFGIEGVSEFEITDKPCCTKKQREPEYCLSIYVRQWSVGIEGDSYNGIVSVPLRDKKFFTFKYSC